MVFEFGIKRYGGFPSSAEVVFSDGHYIPLNFIVGLEHKCVLCCINLTLPQVDCARRLVTAFLGAQHKCIVVQAKVLQKGHALWRTKHHGRRLRPSHGRESESAKHFLYCKDFNYY